MTHDEAVIRAFIRPDRQARLLVLCGSAKGRPKLRAHLAHMDDLDPRFKVEIPSSQQNPAGIERLLRAAGAGDSCTLIAESSELDGKTMPLEAALREIVGSGSAAIVSCIPGFLAHYEGEEAGDRFLLQRSTGD